MNERHPCMIALMTVLAVIGIIHVILVALLSIWILLVQERGFG